MAANRTKGKGKHGAGGKRVGGGSDEGCNHAAPAAPGLAAILSPGKARKANRKANVGGVERGGKKGATAVRGRAGGR
jgi:hypothetical protein